MRAGDWIILRTAARSTLPLAKSLAEDGYDVWTPIETKTITNARFNVKREASLPILPRFIFARVGHLLDLLAIAAMPERPRWGAGCRKPAHNAFSVYHMQDRIPLIADRDLESLRTAETRAVPKRKRRPYEKKERVRVPEGSFAGMSGIVQEDDGRFALVNFGGSMRVKIASFLLRPDSVGTDQPNFADAA